MASFPALTAQECAKAILEIEDPLVVMHANPDGDTVATAGALLEAFRALGREARYACADAIPYDLEFLLDGCTATEDFSGLSPVLVDVPTVAHLGALGDKITPALAIDHHVTDEHYAPYYSHPAASAGEVLYEVLKLLEDGGKLKISPLVADRLYASISSDTDGFMLSNASAATYRYCAELIERGARPHAVNRNLFFSKKKEVIMAEGYVGLHIKTGGGGKIAYAVIPRGDRGALGASFEDFNTAIDIVCSLGGAEVFFVIKETDKGEYKAWLRSLGRVDVSKVSAIFGGTGYSLNAKCTVDKATINEAGKTLVREIERIL